MTGKASTNHTRAGTLVAAAEEREESKLVEQEVPNTGTGVSFTGNTLSGTVNVGIGVSGFTDVRVAGNVLNSLTLGRFRGVCPLAPIAVGPPAVSSGSIQPPAPAFLPDVCL